MLFACEIFTAIAITLYSAAATLFMILGALKSEWLFLAAVLCLSIVLILGTCAITLMKEKQSKACRFVLAVFGGAAGIFYWKWYDAKMKEMEPPLPSGMVKCPFCQKPVLLNTDFCPNCRCPLSDHKKNMDEDPASCE